MRSPVTDQPCVYWRLRIVERLTVGSDLVHEMASSQSFRLLWGARDVARPPVRILVEPDAARIEAAPTLHRHGSPGALAVARAFGFPGALSVEETTIVPGDELVAVGTLFDPRVDAGPFRTVDREPELHDATLTLAVSAGGGAAAVGGRHGGRGAGRHRPRDLGGVALSRRCPGGHPVRVATRPTYLERPQFPRPAAAVTRFRSPAPRSGGVGAR